MSDFDISKFSDAVLKSPATWAQTWKIAYKFGKDDYLRRKRIQGCLWHFVKKKQFTFADASKLIDKSKTFPAKYEKTLKEYLAHKASAKSVQKNVQNMTKQSFAKKFKPMK